MVIISYMYAQHPSKKLEKALIINPKDNLMMDGSVSR